MDKRYYLISDIHGFYDEMMGSLTKAGYSKDNENHVLVVLGDVFDRGDQAIEVRDFLMGLPSDRLILIRGNHESLMRDMIRRKEYYSYDLSNGTVDSVAQLCGYHSRWEMLMARPNNFELCCHNMAWFDEWVYGKDSPWRNFFELGDYVMVHAWIPVKLPPSEEAYGNDFKSADYDPDWRDADNERWDGAEWSDPLKLIDRQIYPEGKTIICGHWTSSDFHVKYENSDTRDYSTYFGSRCIALDATTCMSGMCNVVVLVKRKDGTAQLIKHPRKSK